MTILNHDNDGNHNVLICLLRYLTYKKNIPQDEKFILDKLGFGLEDTSRISYTLKTWTKLGVLTRSEDDKISITEDIGTRLLSSTNFEVDTGRILRSTLFKKDNNTEILLDFNYALSWFLSHDKLISAKSYSNAFEQYKNQFPADSMPITNNTRWGGFTRWVMFLGFAERVGDDYLPDPTRAVKESLPEIFENQNEFSSSEFLSKIREKIPVLEGGWMSDKVTREMTNYQKPPDTRCSFSLAVALKRLNDAGIIELGRPADPLAIPILNQDFNLSFTKVLFNG